MEITQGVQSELDRIQKKLDNKEVNPSDLNEDQYRSLNYHFKEGNLSGYNSVEEMANERFSAKQKIVADAEKKRNPTGNSNLMYVLGADMVAQTYVYAKDADKLRAASLEPKAAENFKITHSKLGRAFGSIVTKTVGRRFKPVRKLFRNTANWFSQKADAGAKFTKSQRAKTEVKSIIAGATGSAAGAAAFEQINYQKGLTSNLLYDLSDISNREIDKMSVGERTFVAAQAEFANGMLYNTIGTALSPVLGKIYRRVKGTVLGVGGSDAGGKAVKKTAEIMNEKGVPATGLELAQQNVGFFPSLVSGYARTLGQLPLINTVLTTYSRSQQEKASTLFLKDLTRDFGPIFHSHLFGAEMYPAILKNHKQFRNTINANYEQLYRRADIMDNPSVVPTTMMKKAADEIVGNFKAGEIKSVTSDVLDDIASPFGQLIKRLTDLPSHIDPKQYLNLQRELHKQVGIEAGLNPNSVLLGNLGILRKNMEVDFNSVAGTAGKAKYLQENPVFKAQYDKILNEQGKGAAQAYTKKMMRELDEWGKTLEDANNFYASIGTKLTGESSVKNMLRMFDDNLLREAGIAGVEGGEKDVISNMFNRTFDLVVKDGDQLHVKELRFLLGAAGSKVPRTIRKTLKKIGVDDDLAGTLIKDAVKLGKTQDDIFNRFVGRSLTDAFFKSFERVTAESTFTAAGNKVYADGTTAAGTFFKSNSAKVGKRVFDGDFLDKSLPRIDLADDFGGSLRKQLKVGQTFKRSKGEEVATNLLKVDASVLKTGKYNHEIFEEILGLNKSNAQGRMIELFGGGAKGKAHYEDFEKLMTVMRTVGGVKYGDISAFLSRRIQLGGVAALAGTGAIAGGASALGAGGIVFVLLGAAFGKFLMNPRNVKHALDIWTPAERAANIGAKDQFFDGALAKTAKKYFGSDFGISTPRQEKALISLVNQLINDDPTAFEGKYAPNITDEMLINYLNNFQAQIPRTDNLDPSDFAKGFGESFMPETTAYAKAPPEMKQAIDASNLGIADGIERIYANRTLPEQQEVRAARESGQPMPEENMGEIPDLNAPVETAQQNIQPVQIGNPQQQNQQQTAEPAQISYESMFPNDALGEMIAKRNEMAKRKV